MHRHTFLSCLLGLACSDQSVKVLEPQAVFSVTITDPEDEATVPAGSSRAARARVELSQGATEDVDATWLLNGAELCATTPVDRDGLSTCAFEPPTGPFDLAVEAVAPSNAIATDTIRLEGVAPDTPTEEEPPTAPTVTLSPDPATTTDSLVAEATGSQASDGSAVSYRFAWTVDGATHDGDAATVVAADTARDQTWTVVVTPIANGVEGPAGSAMLEIQNTPPSAPTVAVVPDAPSAGIDAMQCVLQTESLDADADPVSYRMTWTVDGATVPGSDDTGTPDATPDTTTWTDDTIPAALLTAGEWTCTVEPYDGTDEGSVASATVRVEEPLPNDCPVASCSLEFDGVDDFVEVPHDGSLDVGTTGLTVEAWLLYSTIDTDCMVGVRKGTSASASFAYWLHKNGAPVDSLYWGSWPAFTCLSWEAVRAGQWVHYAGVWDPSTNTARTYINGVAFCDEALTSPIQNNTEPLRIGIDWDWGCPMHGVIDEVRISRVARYTSAFTPSTAHTPDADTMALYSFDAYAGSTLYDRSGNGNHGVIDGAVWSTSSPP